MREPRNRERAKFIEGDVLIITFSKFRIRDIP